jgi:hypothetical protein
MPTKGLTKDGELSSAFDRQMMKFLDAVWDGIRSGQMSESQGKAYVAHIIAAMHVQGADAVGGYFDVVLDKPANTRWKT